MQIKLYEIAKLYWFFCVHFQSKSRFHVRNRQRCRKKNATDEEELDGTEKDHSVINAIGESVFSTSI